MKLKKAANILFLVGAILSIVIAAGLLISAIACFVIPSIPEVKTLLVEAIEKGTVHSDIPGTPEDIANIILGSLLGFGVFFIITAVFTAVNAIMAFKGRNSSSKAIFILNIVFGVLGCTYVNVVGAVFGLIKGDTVVNEEQ